MVEKINTYLGYILVVLMALITLDVLWGVFTRYIVGSQASWSEELARYLLIWIGILGTAYASGKNMHLSIDLLSPSLSPKYRIILRWIISIFIIFFAITAMVIGGGRLIFITAKLGQTSAALGIPMEYVYGVIPVSGILIVIYKISQLLRPRPNEESVKQND